MLRKLAIVATGIVAVFVLIVLINSLVGLGSNDGAIALDPAQLPERFQADRVSRPGQIPQIGEGAGGWVQRTDPETGRLTQEFHYAQLQPREPGEFDVTGPEARLHLAPHRVIYLRADSGHIVAPDNIPQQGTFTGNCRIVIYETRKGGRVDLAPDSPDIVATIKLDDATYDARLGKIDSLGPVVMESQVAEFRGNRLTLVFNEPRQRIDYLEIAEGDYLRLLPAAQELADNQASRGTPTPSRPSNEPAPDVQYYQVVFDSAVKVRSEGRSLDADRLVGLLAFDRKSASAKSLTRGKSQLPPAGALAMAGPVSHAVLSAAIAQQEAQMPEVVMTWSGPMVVTPLTERPRQLVGDQDILLTFTGAPITVRSENDDVLLCDHVTYQESSKRLSAVGSATHALNIDSPALGIVMAEELFVKVDDRTGGMTGPGTLSAHPPPQVDGFSATGSKVRGLPAGFRLQWNHHVELVFAGPDEPEGLALARFVGDVHVEDARFTMRGRELGIHFTPTADGQSRRFSAIDAAGNVHVESEDGIAEGQQLRLELAEGPDGDVRPTELNASGNVRVADATQEIRAEKLYATFIDRPVDGGEPKLDVAMVDALENVQLTLDGDTHVEAHHLTADADAQVATLIGDPVIVRREGGELRVTRLDLFDDGQLAEALGPGTFSFDEAGEGGDRRRMHVKWDRLMRYNQRTHVLDVAGAVAARQSDRPGEMNELSAEQLSLEFLDPEAAGFESRTDMGLKRMSASRDIVLTATRWDDPQQQQLRHRIHITGNVLNFDNATETARINGPGTMLIEDYSPSSRDSSQSAVKLAGPGATLFTWNGSMTMDGAHTDVVLDGAVQMTHRPAADERVIGMLTDRLVADMQGIGGAAAMRMSELNSVEIDHITASGSVLLRDDRHLISAHQLDYVGLTQTAILTALPNRVVQLVQLDEAKPIRAGRIVWDLKRDRIEVEKADF